MLVRDVMTKEVVYVSPDTSVEKVAELLIENKIHGVPVLDEGVLVGIITETDFFTKGSIRIYLPEYINFIKKNGLPGSVSGQEKEKIKLLTSASAKDIMSSSCVTIKEDRDVTDFFAIVREKRLITVPVIDDNNKLVGIITLADIINLINIGN